MMAYDQQLRTMVAAVAFVSPEWARVTNAGGAPMNAALLKPSSCLMVPLRRGQSLWVMIERLAPAHGWLRRE